ncbi:MAG TPA: hypothetical protein VGB37_14345 [Candidatus Lokiarchaeia archaeon]
MSCETDFWRHSNITIDCFDASEWETTLLVIIFAALIFGIIYLFILLIQELNRRRLKNGTKKETFEDS